MSKKGVFPPYLQEGSNGAAVDALHVLLCSLGYGADIIRDGDYGGKTVAAVKELQKDLDFTGDDVDGKFGPGTRAALVLQKGINADSIPPSPQCPFLSITNFVGPDTPEGETETWDPCQN